MTKPRYGLRWRRRDAQATLAFTIRRRPARYLGAGLLALSATQALLTVILNGYLAAIVAAVASLALGGGLLLAEDYRFRRRARHVREEADVS